MSKEKIKEGRKKGRMEWRSQESKLWGNSRIHGVPALREFSLLMGRQLCKHQDQSYRSLWANHRGGSPAASGPPPGKTFAPGQELHRRPCPTPRLWTLRCAVRRAPSCLHPPTFHLESLSSVAPSIMPSIPTLSVQRFLYPERQLLKSPSKLLGGGRGAPAKL